MLPLRIVYICGAIIWMALALWCFKLAYGCYKDNEVMLMLLTILVGAQLAITAILHHLKKAISGSQSALISS
jgi:hypothetical protein